MTRKESLNQIPRRDGNLELAANLPLGWDLEFRFNLFHPINSFRVAPRLQLCSNLWSAILNRRRLRATAKALGETWNLSPARVNRFRNQFFCSFSSWVGKCILSSLTSSVGWLSDSVEIHRAAEIGEIIVRIIGMNHQVFSSLRNGKISRLMRDDHASLVLFLRFHNHH